ncbi:MAG: putative bifunctional diguanylate cyclase/phosphodiesterase [Rubricella sp.]
MPRLEKSDPRRVAALRIGAQATHAYVAALGLLAALALVLFQMSGDAIAREREAQALAQIASSQSARVQSMALALQQYAMTADPNERALLRAEIAGTRDELIANHVALVSRSGAARYDPELDRIWYQGPLRGDFTVRRFAQLGDLILAAEARGAHHDLVSQVVEMARTSLPAVLGAAVGAHEARVEEALVKIERFAVLHLAGSILILVSVGLFVFRPIVRRAVRETIRLFEAEDALHHTSTHDLLTGLPNRTGAMAYLVRQETGRTGRGIGAIRLDIEAFSQINDTMGQKAGDDILQICADRLRAAIRQGDFVARYGADDFLLLFPDIASETELQEIADRLQTALGQPITLLDRDLELTAAFGLAFATEPVARDQLVLDADMALTEAREAARGATQVYSPTMRADLQLRDAILRQLRSGLDRGEVLPHFQPQIDAATGAVTGFEALARWHHPERGVLTPGHFLDLAERDGLGPRIAELMLERSCEAMARWQGAGHDIRQIGVNFSSDQLRDSDLCTRIQLVADGFDLAPERIAIEILETVLVEDDDDAVVRSVRRLKDAGFGIDLDDFGNGHASISNIRRFNVDRIKIDRAFVSGLDRDENLRKMTLAMIRMAQGLGIETLAEGVETTAEQHTLTAMGVTHLQGFGIGRPMPFEETLAWLSEHRLRTAALQAARRHPA